jgi:hypothetical protein
MPSTSYQCEPSVPVASVQGLLMPDAATGSGLDCRMELADAGEPTVHSSMYTPTATPAAAVVAECVASPRRVTRMLLALNAVPLAPWSLRGPA